MVTIVASNANGVHLFRGGRLLDRLRHEGGRKQARGGLAVQQVVLVLDDALADGGLNLSDDPFDHLRLEDQKGHLV